MRAAIVAATGLGLTICGGAGAQVEELDPFIAISCTTWLQNAELHQGAADMLHAIGNIELNDIGRSIGDNVWWLFLLGLVGASFGAIRGLRLDRLEQEAKEAKKKREAEAAASGKAKVGG